jgi:hypothetical protein
VRYVYELPDGIPKEWCNRGMHRKEGLRTPAELMLTPTVTWADVTLDPGSLAELQRLAGSALPQGQPRAVVQDGGREGGALLIFTGEDTRNRRLVAEALANAMNVPIFRVDLGAVDSKWVAQTEANLDRVFAAADRAGVVLLLDEADALFGERTHVSDAHDRYSAEDIAYLLQKLEEHAGLCILATNSKQNIDPAFIRRARLLIPFPRR